MNVAVAQLGVSSWIQQLACCALRERNLRLFLPASGTRIFRALTLALVVLSMPRLAFAAGDFSAWWPKFQTAIAAHDVQAVAYGAKFPMSWENGPVRQIPAASDFTSRFDTYVTPEIRHAIAKIKPERLPNGTYILTWKARGNEYSLYFAPLGDAYALDGLSEGPP